MGSANTSTVSGMLQEIVEGLSRRGHDITERTIVTQERSWIVVTDDYGYRYRIEVTRA